MRRKKGEMGRTQNNASWWGGEGGGTIGNKKEGEKVRKR